MTDKKLVVFGVYSNREPLGRAVEQLQSAGFGDADISVVLSGGQGAATVEQVEARDPKNANEKVKDLTSKDTRDISSGRSTDVETKNTKAPQAAATGAGIGAALGGSLGLVATLSAIAIPGIGPLLIAGPLLGAFAGAAAGGAVGVLVGVGIPEDEAKLYEERLKKGGLLVSVHAETREEADRARAIFQQTGATDIAATHEARPEPIETKGIPRAAGR
jgi:Protein of unknown function (DUF1269)